MYWWSLTFNFQAKKKQLVLWTARSHACALRVTRVPVVYPITVSTGSILNHWPGDECFYWIRPSSILTGSFYSNSELAELPMCMQYSFRCRQTGFACICRITLVFIYEELVAHSEYIYILWMLLWLTVPSIYSIHRQTYLLAIFLK